MGTCEIYWLFELHLIARKQIQKMYLLCYNIWSLCLLSICNLYVLYTYTHGFVKTELTFIKLQCTYSLLFLETGGL